MELGGFEPPTSWVRSKEGSYGGVARKVAFGSSFLTI
jgi:hypothetical protein